MAHLGNTVVNGALRVLGGENVDTINGVTVGASPKFTDTNNKVTQTATTANAAYEVLFSETADNTTRTEGSKKAATLRFNPASAALMQGTATVASGFNSHAEGYGTTASGQSSHAEGYNTLVVTELYDSMYGSHAEGYQTTCGRDGSGKHAEGFKTSAYGTGAHSEGIGTVAKGDGGCHAEGWYTTASGLESHAEGSKTIAQGASSHAAGEGTVASGVCQTVIGKYNVADTSSAFIIGNGNSSTRSNAFKVDFTGNINTKGCLTINSTTGDFSEGLRLNLASNGYTTLTIGTTNGSTNGISDGGFWIGTYTGTRKLYIAHNASTQSATYFGADSNNAYSPYLNLGSSGTVENGNTRAVTGGAVYSFMQPGVKTFQVERGSSFSTSRQGYWAGMLRTDQSGSPTLPIANKWFHVLSMDWGNDSANWVSQLAIGTQEDSNSGVWWRCNNAGGTDISSSTWKHLVEDTQAPPQHSFDFTLTSDNNNKWYKVLSRGNGVPSTSSFKGIITISVAYYGYTNGTTKSFMLQSFYQSMTLYPFDSIEDEVGWLPTWRVSVDSTNMYLEFYVSNIPSPAQNPFRITYTSLSNTHSGDPITFYDTLTPSTATAVVQQYTIKTAFRTLTASEALEAGSATWTRTASTAGSVTLRRYGKVKELVIWGTALPAVSGAAVSTLQLSDPSYYPLHNNVQFTGSDDNSQIVIGYITTGGTVYLANRSTSPIYCNVTYM